MMETDIVASAWDPYSYNLFVNGELMVRQESLTVCENIAASIKNGGAGTIECAEVARSIIDHFKVTK